jgi:hypothetical protein
MIPFAIAGTGIALAYSYMSGPKNNVKVKSSIDNKEYFVQNLPDKQKAADILSSIRTKLTNLVSSFKEDINSNQDPAYQRLIQKFNPEVLEENDINADSTSYSENKGQKIIVCIRHKKEPYPFVDENTIMFVLLHELSHLMTESTGHTSEFWTNFRRLLHDSVKKGVYTPINYTQTPQNYCGMTITDSPI